MSISPISFGSELTLQVANASKTNNTATPVAENSNKDSLNLKEEAKEVKEIAKTDVKEAKEEKKEKKSIFEKFANFIGSCKKIGVNIKEYSKGIFKGAGAFVAGSVVTVGGIFTVDKVRQGIKAAKETEKGALGEILTKFGKGVSKNFTKEGIKTTLKSGKGILTIAGGLAVGVLCFAKKIYDAKLKANEQKAMLDHKYVNTPVISK